MSSPRSETVSEGLTFADEETLERSYWGPVVVSVLVLLWFYAFEIRYGPGRSQSALDWIWSAWNPETDYEHGPLFPLIIVGLIAYSFRNLKSVAGKGSFWGLAVVLLGALF